MEKKSSLISLVIAAAFAGAIMSGCKGDDIQEQDSAGLTITTEDNMAVAADGGSYTVEYILGEGVSGPVSASVPSGISWVKDFDTETPGTVTFTAQANFSGQERRADITITCQDASDRITVVQPSVENAPVLRIVSVEGADADEFEVPASYSEDNELRYEISNPVDGGTLAASCDKFWVMIDEENSFKEGNSIFFSVSGNDTDASREAVVTVTYSFEGGSVYDSFTVVQEAPTPSITISEEKITADAESESGVQEQLVYYTLSARGTDGRVSYSLKDMDGAEPDWLTASDVGYSTPGSGEGAYIQLQIEDNPGTDARSAVLTVTYTYGRGNTVSDDITIEQAGRNGGGPTENDFNASFCTAKYEYEDEYGREYTLTFFDAEKKTVEYVFDIFIDPSAAGNTIPAGEYVLDGGAYSAGTFSFAALITHDYYTMGGSEYDETTQTDFTGGTLTVSGEGDSCTFTGSLTDAAGNGYTVTYTGPVAFE